VTDILGYRAKIAVLVPVTNTVVEPEMHAVAPRGVTLHTGRFAVFQSDLRSDRPEQEVMEGVYAKFEPSITEIVRTLPSHLIMGFTAPSYWGGRAGNQEFERRLQALAGGVPVTTGAGSLDKALQALGARKVAVLTPYTPAITQQVERFLTESGYEVTGSVSMQVAPPVAIAQVPDSQIIAALRELQRGGPDAIVQSGSNLPMAYLADGAERWLGCAVLSINVAMLWDALRRVGVQDQVDGFGRLLREH
jgi:maleate isomerase